MIGERSGTFLSLMGKTPTGNWWGGVRGWCLPYILVLSYAFHDNLWQTFHITQLNSSPIMFLLFLTNRCPWWLTSYLRWKCLALQIWRLWVNIIKIPLCFCQIIRPWLALLFCINIWVNYDSIWCKYFFPGGFLGDCLEEVTDLLYLKLHLHVH